MTSIVFYLLFETSKEKERLLLLDPPTFLLITELYEALPVATLGYSSTLALIRIHTLLPISFGFWIKVS